MYTHTGFLFIPFPSFFCPLLAEEMRSPDEVTVPFELFNFTYLFMSTLLVLWVIRIFKEVAQLMEFRSAFYKSSVVPLNGLREYVFDLDAV